MIPRPVKAMVLVFPWEEARYRRAAEDEIIAKEGGPKVDESIFWMKQTVCLCISIYPLFYSLRVVRPNCRFTTHVAQWPSSMV
jgi:ubiquitin carboxyl-terminal hydrolase L3